MFVKSDDVKKRRYRYPTFKNDGISNFALQGQWRQRRRSQRIIEEGEPYCLMEMKFGVHQFLIIWLVVYTTIYSCISQCGVEFLNHHFLVMTRPSFKGSLMKWTNLMIEAPSKKVVMFDAGRTPSVHLPIWQAVVEKWHVHLPLNPWSYGRCDSSCPMC